MTSGPQLGAFTIYNYARIKDKYKEHNSDKFNFYGILLGTRDYQFCGNVYIIPFDVWYRIPDNVMWVENISFASLQKNSSVADWYSYQLINAIVKDLFELQAWHMMCTNRAMATYGILGEINSKLMMLFQKLKIRISLTIFGGTIYLLIQDLASPTKSNS